LSQAGSRWWVQPVLLCAGLLFLAAVALLPLFSHTTLPRGDDVGEHVQFVQDFSAGLAEGIVYPRWLPHANLGYGAPVFIFYPPLATALVASLNVAGFDLFTSFRLGLLLLTLGAAATAALLGMQRTAQASAWTGLAAGGLWVLMPYHALDVFGRFALAETATFVFLPLLFLSLDRRQGVHLTGTAAAFAGLCFSHLPTAFLAAWFVMGWNLLRGTRQLGKAALALILGTGCAAVYLLPALLERGQVHAGWLEENPIYRFDAHYLFFPSYTLIRNDPVHGTYHGWLDTSTLSQIRIIVPATLALALAAWLTRLVLHRRQTGWDPMYRYLFLVLIATAGMTRLADPIWRWVPGFASVVFPWRLTLFLTLGTSILVAVALHDLAKRSTTLVTVAAMVILAAASFMSFRIAGTADWETFTRGHTATPVVRLRITGAMMPRSNPLMRGFSRQPRAGPASLLTASDHPPGRVETVQEKTHARSYAVSVQDSQGAQLLVPQFDYPGWSARVDGSPVPVEQQPPLGTLAIPVPPGDHLVELNFGNTGTRLAAMSLSVISILILLALTLFRRCRTMRARRPA
jgi:hypothetical protein